MEEDDLVSSIADHVPSSGIPRKYAYFVFKLTMCFAAFTAH